MPNTKSQKTAITILRAVAKEAGQNFENPVVHKVLVSKMADAFEKRDDEITVLKRRIAQLECALNNENDDDNDVVEPTDEWRSRFLKDMTPSHSLAQIIGPEPRSRTAITKEIWEYIKSNKLQNPENRRNIIMDDKLKAISKGKTEISMFELTALINAHLS